MIEKRGVDEMGKRRFARWPNQVGLALIKRYPVASYLIAGVGALAAGLSHRWLVPLIGDTPPMRLMLVVVVTVSAWLGGLARACWRPCWG